jgi:hypothetical protein
MAVMKSKPSKRGDGVPPASTSELGNQSEMCTFSVEDPHIYIYIYKRRPNTVRRETMPERHGMIND